MKHYARVVSTGFWEDSMVVNDFSPEDKYFMLYLLTNPHTSQLGIYQLVPKKAAFELGYSIDSVNVLLDRFENKYSIIRYSNETSEIAIKNFLKHSIVKGGKPVMDCLLKEESMVKDKSLLVYIFNSLNNIDDLNLTIKDYLEHINDKYINNDNDNENERIVACDFLRFDDDFTSSDNGKDIKKEIEDVFESLWKLYPRKLGKGSIKPKTKERIYRVGFDNMKKCIERYKASVAGKDEQYIQYGSTFFNSGYVDYLDENYTSSDDSNDNQCSLFDDSEGWQ